MKRRQVRRRIKANYVLPVTSEPIKDGVVELDEKGFVVGIYQESHVESRNTEYYSGVLIPGLINSHCHLELSHLRGEIPEKTGLASFVQEISTSRFNNMLNKDVLRRWDRFMYLQGIQLVGDVCNTLYTIDIKLNSQIEYVNFIEVFGSKASVASKAFRQGLKLLDSFVLNGLEKSFLSPHAIYSISHDLWSFLGGYWGENPEVIVSVHNQESISENDLFLKAEGPLARLIASFGIDPKKELCSGATSIYALIEKVRMLKHVLLIHNSTTTLDEVLWAKRNMESLFWVLCPKSNLYIEGVLPDLSVFQQDSNNVCIGTDSLASNSILSVFEEMKVLTQNFPSLSFDELLRWATYNGARALKCDDVMGSIEIGKKPGINLVYPFDFEVFKLKQNSLIKRLA